MNRLKTYDFWVKLAAAIILIVRIVASKFNIDVDGELIMDIVTGACGIFVVFGIISAPTSLVKTKKEGETNMDEEKIETEIENEKDLNAIPSNEDFEVKEEIKEENKEEKTEETFKDAEGETSFEDCEKEWNDGESLKDEIIDKVDNKSCDVFITENSVNNLLSRIDYLISKFESLLNE